MKSPIEYLKGLMRNDRMWRWFLVALFTVPVLLVLPHARSLIVRNAVTTAQILELNAPISGSVTALAASAGSVAKAGKPVVSLFNEKEDSSRVARLEALKTYSESEVARLTQQLELVTSVAQARRAEMFAYTEAVNLDVARQLQTARDRSVALKSALREAESNLERVSSLHESGLLSRSDLEAADAAYESAQADFSGNQLEISRLEQQLEEIRKSVFQVNVPDGALLTRQSVQDLDLEVLRLEQALGESRGRLAATTAELERAERAFAKASSAEMMLPEGRVVWSVYTAPGAWVSEGSPLLSFVDCSRLMLDIAVDDATLELIEPGMKVNVRLFGSFEYREGTVALVRGSSALKSDRLVYAAQVENRGQRKGRVLARIDAPDLADQPGESCGIGRTAYAEFEDINLFEMILLPLFR